MTWATKAIVIMSTASALGIGCARQSVQTVAPGSEVPSYTMKRATNPITVDGSLAESDWEHADGIELIFPWWNQSQGPKDKTEAKMLWDDSYLYVSWVSKDPHVSAYVSQRDGATWEDDCVEVFIAPDPQKVRDYYGFEINAKGVVLDYRRPEGKDLDRDWDSEGTQIAVVVDGTLNNDADRDTKWVVEVAIPLADLSTETPVAGDMWRLNLNRCGGETKCQYSQWSSSRTARPNFHVAERFGQVFFED